MRLLLSRWIRVATLGLIGIGPGPVNSAELLPPGYRPLPPGVHALVGARICPRPGEVIPSGTVVIRDGRIESVGAQVAVPADARVWDLKGATVYAGFIEPSFPLTPTNRPVMTSDASPVRNQTLTYGGVQFFGAPGDQVDPGRPGSGSDLVRFQPETRALSFYTPDAKVLGSLREQGFTAALVVPGHGILRGSSALVSLSDEDPNKALLRPDVFQHVAFETHDEDGSQYPSSLMGVLAALRQVFLDARYSVVDRADFARRPQDRPRPEYDPSLEALLPAAEGRMPVFFEAGSVLMDARAAKLAGELGLRYALLASGEEWRRPDLVRETGASFVVPVNFPELPKLPSTDDWSQVSLDMLRAWDWAPENPAVLRRAGLPVALTTYGLEDRKNFRKNVRLGMDRGLSEDDALAALTTVPARLCGVEDMLGTIEPGKIADLVVVDGTNYFNPEARVRAVWIDGRVYPVPPDLEAKDSKSATNAPAIPDARDSRKVRLAHAPLEGRGPVETPGAVWISGATIWTCGPQGILTNADLLVANGKIVSVGAVGAASGAAHVDGRGWFITPGIIDCHSHTAILGNVNEPTLPSTAMVRIADVVNSETENLHQQLAGGVTLVNLLHGSANPIGGQNCVIKLRDGAGPDELVFSNAPPGIKFALGENVKEANWGDAFVTRFPQSRTGVRAFVANRFTAAREYAQAWQAWSNAPAGTLPPRRNLELETLAQILAGQRWIHCHAYRQDEMLMLTRLMQSFGVQIGTFQHALEGYKIADELAAAGIGASSFSDWWAYKFEVYDAIPYNGSLMRERGVVVSFNSDSSELARRLYLEAAKAVKYGRTPEIEALNFVTINSARQLRIDRYVGSLEPGKDADFAVWSKSPLAFDTVCLQTWIDGRKYFDRSLEPARAARLAGEREALLTKARKLAAGANEGGKPGSDPAKSGFFRVSLEHQYDGRDRDCLDER
ncbi:MAG: amidohydrolase family protein [Verrucomicrobiota bacterium]